MKFIVGYQPNYDFIRYVIAHSDQISEVYFSWTDQPSGRSPLTENSRLTPYELQQLQCRHLSELSAANIKLNLLLNANCYGSDSQSRSFFNNLGGIIDYITKNFTLATVTTSSLLIAKFIRTNFPKLDVRASVNMSVADEKGLEYVSEYFTSYYIARELNRNEKMLDRVKKWCDDNGKKMYLLANSGCLKNCSAHTFHDNLVAHEREIAKMDNGYQFTGVCWEYLKAQPQAFLSSTTFIRPEDVSYYEKYTSAVKLATRINAAPITVVNAYLSGKYAGGVNTLLEPNHSSLFYPTVLENSLFPADFAKITRTCDGNCSKCSYCKEVYEKISVNIGDLRYAD